ncbi:MAG TPA: roadblock/LC7 domain-containing protein [Vicinamibacteria bacterium]|nr:roadblock/LC7 domain-containing protein [Vicinamibacteria bacterium]
MPYQRLVDDLVDAVEAHGALLLDSEGEVVVAGGVRDVRHRLIGAYQGLALAAARRTFERHGGGSIEYIMCRYTEQTVILRPLKDGYYLVLSLSSAGRVGEGLHHSGRAQELLNREL